LHKNIHFSTFLVADPGSAVCLSAAPGTQTFFAAKFVSASHTHLFAFVTTFETAEKLRNIHVRKFKINETKQIATGTPI